MIVNTLKKYYYEKSVSYRDISKSIGVSSTTVYKWLEEGKKPNKKHQYRIRKFLEEQESGSTTDMEGYVEETPSDTPDTSATNRIQKQLDQLYDIFLTIRDAFYNEAIEDKNIYVYGDFTLEHNLSNLKEDDQQIVEVEGKKYFRDVKIFPYIRKS